MLVMGAATRYAIIPTPTLLKESEGQFKFSAGTTLYTDKTFRAVADQFSKRIESGTGIRLSRKGELSRGIVFRSDSNLGEEGYRLDVRPSIIEVRAMTPAGAFYATQTLYQLLPTKFFGGVSKPTEWSVPCVSIEDQPEFSWRGAHLDVGRHFMPKEWIKKYLDVLAMHKINVFHWHLTEDQGWRIEIKKYPKLTSVGSKRKATMLKYSPAEMENTPYEGFYTQADAKEIVKYAKERFITVVPEIEMPGHAQAAIAAYPELGNTGKQLEVATRWGVIPHVFNAEEKTISFLQDVLDEVLQIFPSKYIHVGGDECPKDEWKASPRAQQLIKERGLKDEHELQSWFIRQMDSYLEKKGRHLIGWDEILEGGLAPGAAVMSWRGEAGGIAAANENHKVVMASNNALYFDYYQADPKREPHAIGGFLPVEKVYSYDLVPSKLSADKKMYILGGQFQLWTEYIRTPSHAEYMAFPRGCAAAEIFWSPKSRRNLSDFQERLKVHVQRLDGLGVNYRKLD